MSDAVGPAALRLTSCWSCEQQEDDDVGTGFIVYLFV